MVYPYVGCKVKFIDKRDNHTYTVWDKKGQTVKLRRMPLADGDDQWIYDILTYDLEWTAP